MDVKRQHNKNKNTDLLLFIYIFYAFITAVQSIHVLVYCSSQVCANGFVSFDDEYWYSWPPGDIEKLSDRTILAPFFTNMEFSGIGGAIYYHEYNPDSTISFESNHNVQQAKLYISDIFGKSIKIKYLFVATWFQARRDGWLSSYYVWFNEEDGRWEYDYIPENAEKVRAQMRH